MSANHKGGGLSSAQAPRQSMFATVPLSGSLMTAQSPSDVSRTPDAGTDTLIVSVDFIAALKEISEFLEADKKCGKGSGYVQRARARLKRLLDNIPTSA